MTADDVLPIGEEPTNEAPASLDYLITDYATLRANRERLDDATKEARRKEEAAEAKLFEALERLNLRSVKHDLGQFILNDLAWPAITDPVAAREWILAEMPEILNANQSKLAVVVREALRGERTMPPGMDAKFSRKINWRKS